MDFLFDIGRVLLDFDFDASMQRILKNKTVESNERLIRAIENRNFFERGEIEATEFIKQSIEIIDSTIDPQDFRDAWRQIFTRNPAMWDVVRRLKAQGMHRLILFSNTNAIHCPWIFEEFPEFDLFDEKVLSYEVGAIKPDAAIYDYAIREFELDPRRTIYIDDLPENIATGEQFGLRCHLYRIDHHDDFESWLWQEMVKD